MKRSTGWIIAAGVFLALAILALLVSWSPAPHVQAAPQPKTATASATTTPAPTAAATANPGVTGTAISTMCAVNVPVLNVRRCNSLHCEIVGSLVAGERVRVIRRDGGWSLVDGRQYGWISSEFCK